MLRLGTIMIAAMLLAPAHGHEAEPAPPPKAEKPAVPIKIFQTRRGTILADSRGMTLYYFDRDDTGNKSTCDGKCAENGFRSQPPTTPRR
jgi:predicted lipoprotein with Yx(FWY)xxD motif